MKFVKFNHLLCSVRLSKFIGLLSTCSCRVFVISFFPLLFFNIGESMALEEEDKKLFFVKEKLDFDPETSCVFFVDETNIISFSCTSTFLSEDGTLIKEGKISGESLKQSNTYYLAYPLPEIGKNIVNSYAIPVHYKGGRPFYASLPRKVSESDIYDLAAIDSLVQDVIKTERERLALEAKKEEREREESELLSAMESSSESRKLLKLEQKKADLEEAVSELELHLASFKELLKSSHQANAPAQVSNQLRRHDLSMAIKRIVELSVRARAPEARK
ncbi:MAG TPA: hypothetical protein PKA63_13635 [Oligoflexia bacterium]|nr:hypothetical protein [Oligoflexia bacterium]HMP49704.1 hypothetical protein [Oligoflexia bacterium]